MDLPKRLRAYRRKWELTQATAARKLGVAATTWNRWENGHARPVGLVLQAVLRMLRDPSPPGQLDLWG